MGVLSFILFIGMLFEQSPVTCEVLLESLKGTYEGECRRGYAHGTGKAEGIDRYQGEFRIGLPHGKGIYAWSNGDTYRGSWRKGQKHGEGLLLDSGNDTLAYGIWKNDEFDREFRVSTAPAYTVRYKKNITRLRFINVSEGNRVFIKLDQGVEPRQISHLNMFGSSGIYLAYTNMFGYEDVTFPFEGRISFYGPSLTGHTTYLIELTYEINEPGNWEVFITY